MDREHHLSSLPLPLPLTTGYYPVHNDSRLLPFSRSLPTLFSSSLLHPFNDISSRPQNMDCNYSGFFGFPAFDLTNGLNEVRAVRSSATSTVTYHNHMSHSLRCLTLMRKNCTWMTSILTSRTLSGILPGIFSPSSTPLLPSFLSTSIFHSFLLLPPPQNRLRHPRPLIFPWRDNQSRSHQPTPDHLLSRRLSHKFRSRPPKKFVTSISARLRRTGKSAARLIGSVRQINLSNDT